MKGNRDEEGFLRSTLQEIRAREEPPPPFAEVVESGRRARASRRRRFVAAAGLLGVALVGALVLGTRGRRSPAAPLPFPGVGPEEPAYRASGRLLAASLRPATVAPPLYPDRGGAERSVAPPLPCWSYGRRLLPGSE